ncbi:MAG: TolC family protein [Armatimonadetes bacterium]|nr:TolC family protein [Armatimonadota bacterium]
MKKALIWIVVFLGWIPAPAFAESTLTLPQAFELARKNNIAFQAVQREAESVEGDLIQAGLIPNPTLELEQKSTPFPGFQEGERGLFLSQELELGGKRSARVSVAQKALEAAQFKVAEIARQLRQKVRVSFYEAWVAQERMKVLEEISASQKLFLDLSKARVKLGDIPGVEVKLVSAEYLRIQQKLEGARKDVQTALADLAQLLALPLDEKPALQAPDKGPADFPDLSGLLSQAFQNRPDLRAQEMNVQKALAQVRLEKALAIPNLTVGAGTVLDKLLIHGEDVSPPGAISEINDSDRLYQIRFSFPLPLFDRNQGNILKSERLYESEILKEQDLRRAIQTEVMTAWQKVAANLKIQERFQKELLPVVKENLHIIEKAYRLGGQSVLAVIQAERTLFETQLDYLDNLRQLEGSIALLESAAGIELP